MGKNLHGCLLSFNAIDANRDYIVLLALALNAILGWDLFWVIVLTGIFVALYSVLGGIEAVMWADAIQGIILIIGAVACVFFISNSTSGGLIELVTQGMSDDKFSLGPYTADLTLPTFLDCIDLWSIYQSPKLWN